MKNRFFFNHLTTGDWMDLSVAAFVFIVMDGIILFIDRKFSVPATAKFFSALFLFIAFCFLAGYIYTAMNHTTLDQSSFYVIDLPMLVILYCLWAVLHFSVFGKKEETYSTPGGSEQIFDNEITISSRANNYSSHLPVYYGKKTKMLPLSDILLIECRNDMVICANNKFEKFYLDQSLSSVQSQLPPHLFFQINRQIILNRNAILGFEGIENKKLVVQFQNIPGSPSEAIVSRYRAPLFRRWINGSNHSTSEKVLLTE